jgi:putative membrane protein
VLAQGKPTDPQIAHIAYTAGTIDIDAAKQALDLCKKVGVTPEDNDTSKSLAAAAKAKRDELAKMSGAAFDKAYIENEVAYHKTVNGALETTLIPSAQNAQLKSLLQTGLKIFQGHEQHAEMAASMVKSSAR